MSVAAVGAGVAAVAGAAISADAASSASNAQKDAANNANATQMGQFNMTRTDQMPFINNGTMGNARLSYLLGINANPGTPGESLGPDRQDILNQFEAQRLAERDAAGNPIEVAYTRLDGADRAAFDAEVDRRYRAAVLQSQAEQAAKLKDAQQNPTDPAFGSLLRKFTANDLSNDPVYQSGLQFGLDQGVQGLTRQAAATGSQLSGGTLKALARYANDYGTTKAEGAYNRFNADKQNTFNMLSGISGTAQTAANTLASSGQNMANNVSQNQIGAGNARGASYIAGANGVNNALSSGVNMYQQNKLLSSMYPQNSMGGYSSSGGGYYPYGGNNLDYGNMS